MIRAQYTDKELIDILKIDNRINKLYNTLYWGEGGSNTDKLKKEYNELENKRYDMVYPKIEGYLKSKGLDLDKMSYEEKRDMYGDLAALQNDVEYEFAKNKNINLTYKDRH